MAPTLRWLGQHHLQCTILKCCQAECSEVWLLVCSNETRSAAV